MQGASRSLGAIWGSVSSFIGVHVSSYLDTLCDIKSWQQVSWPHWFSVTYNKMYSQFPGKGLIPTPSFFSNSSNMADIQWPTASNNAAVPTTLVLQVKGSTDKLATIRYMQHPLSMLTVVWLLLTLSNTRCLVRFRYKRYFVRLRLQNFSVRFRKRS